MEKQLTLGSLFDGIGGFPFAATLSGITPVWASEIEPFCIAVTKQRFPNMLHLGSVTDINGAEIPPVDIITFGSPCQDLSVAGQRAGLDGERSGLFKEAVRIIYEMRNATNGKYPKYIIWENVPGAFSSNKGHDFQTVLKEITKTDIPMPSSGKWGAAGVVRSSGITAAWRLFDAQYWGVPQRRKRIYLVGSFGSCCAETILFKRDSVQRYLKPRGAEGEKASECIRRCIEGGNRENRQFAVDFGTESSRIQINANKSITLQAQGGGAGAKTGLYLLPTMCVDTYNATTIENKTFPLQTPHGANGIPHIINPTIEGSTFCLQGNMIGRADKNGPQGSGINENVSFTVNTIDRHAVAYCEKNTFKSDEDFWEWVVRRLTPLECERLQGYPDFWTCLPSVGYIDEPEFSFWQKVIKLHKEINNKKPTIPLTPNAMAKWYNKLENDGNKYKALGNSLAIPCALRVIGYIADYERNLNNE